MSDNPAPASAPNGGEDPVRFAVRVLTAVHDQSQAAVCLGTGIPKRTMIRRMHTGGWTVDEVRALAQHFGVPVTVLLDGPGALLRDGVAVTPRYPSRNGAVLAA